MGVALALNGAAFSVYTAHGHHQRCITIEERFSRSKRHEPPVPPVESIGAMIEIARASLKAVKMFKIRHVGIKGYAHDAKWQVHQLGEACGIMKAYLWAQYRIVPEIVPPRVARMRVTKSVGRVSQEELRGIVETGFGIPVQNSLEVDATIVARYMFDRMAAQEREMER